MSLVINSLGRGHTQTCRPMIRTGSIFRNQACAWFKNNEFHNHANQMRFTRTGHLWIIYCIQGNVYGVLIIIYFVGDV